MQASPLPKLTAALEPAEEPRPTHRGPVTAQLLQRGAQRPPVRPKTDPRRPRVLSHGFTPRGGCETLGAPLRFLPPPSVQPRGPCVSCLGLKEARVYPKHEFPQLPMGPSVTWTSDPNSVGSLHQPSPRTLPKRLFPLPLTSSALVPHPRQIHFFQRNRFLLSSYCAQVLKPGMYKLVGRLSLSEDHADKRPVMNYELGAAGRAKGSQRSHHWG